MEKKKYTEPKLYEVAVNSKAGGICYHTGTDDSDICQSNGLNAISTCTTSGYDAVGGCESQGSGYGS